MTSLEVLALCAPSWLFSKQRQHWQKFLGFYVWILYALKTLQSSKRIWNDAFTLVGQERGTMHVLRWRLEAFSDPWSTESHFCLGKHLYTFDSNWSTLGKLEAFVHFRCSCFPSWSPCLEIIIILQTRMTKKNWSLWVLPVMAIFFDHMPYWSFFLTIWPRRPYLAVYHMFYFSLHILSEAVRPQIRFKYGSIWGHTLKYAYCIFSTKCW